MGQIKNIKLHIVTDIKNTNYLIKTTYTAMASRILSRITPLVRRTGVRNNSDLQSVVGTSWKVQSGEAFRAAEAAEKVHAAGTALTWKKVSMFVAVPGMILCTVQALLEEFEHMSHPRPEFVPFPHMRIRTSVFPWGDGVKSLFHDAELDALPEGYEE